LNEILNFWERDLSLISCSLRFDLVISKLCELAIQGSIHIVSHLVMVSFVIAIEGGGEKWKINRQFSGEVFSTLEKIVNEIPKNFPFSVDSESNLPC
jgi:hypothetical protein